MVSVKISAASEVGFWGVSRTKQRWDETSQRLHTGIGLFFPNDYL